MTVPAKHFDFTTTSPKRKKSVKCQKKLTLKELFNALALLTVNLELIYAEWAP